MQPRHPELIEVSLEATPVIEAYEKDVDRTLPRENLRPTTAERIEKMIRVAAFADDLRRSQAKAARP